jgi:hypothetical protein
MTKSCRCGGRARRLGLGLLAGYLVMGLMIGFPLLRGEPLEPGEAAPLVGLALFVAFGLTLALWLLLASRGFIEWDHLGLRRRTLLGRGQMAWSDVAAATVKAAWRGEPEFRLTDHAGRRLLIDAAMLGPGGLALIEELRGRLKFQLAEPLRRIEGPGLKLPACFGSQNQPVRGRGVFLLDQTGIHRRGGRDEFWLPWSAVATLTLRRRQDRGEWLRLYGEDTDGVSRHLAVTAGKPEYLSVVAYAAAEALNAEKRDDSAQPPPEHWQPLILSAFGPAVRLAPAAPPTVQDKRQLALVVVLGLLSVVLMQSGVYLQRTRPSSAAWIWLVGGGLATLAVMFIAIMSQARAKRRNRNQPPGAEPPRS